MNLRFKNWQWGEPTTFESKDFADFDFSGANFDAVCFINCTFTQCLFEKGTSGNLAFFGCDFRDCRFKSFDFRRIPLGADGGTFTSCHFLKCNFMGRHFEYPHFDSCVFDQCKIKKVNFNDASFKKVKFIGKIEDTTFNGLYHKKATGFKILDEVDFSEAILGEFVTFEACDLSTCVPPNGGTFAQLLYQLYADEPTTLSTGSTDRIVLRSR